MNVIFFDGICLSCNRYINFINKIDNKKIIFFCDLRSPKAKETLSNNLIEFDLNSILFLKNNQVYNNLDAIIEVFILIGGIYKFFKIFYLLPKPMRKMLYMLVSKNRYLFGKTTNYCRFNPNLAKQLLWLFTFLPLLINAQKIDNHIKVYEVNHYLDSVYGNSKDGVQVSIMYNDSFYTFVNGINHNGFYINDSSVFNIGSTTKLFTSLLIQKAIAENKISYQDKVINFFPAHKNIDPKIRIIDLLNHTSGIGEIGNANNVNNSFFNDTFYMNYGNLTKFLPKPRSRFGVYKYCNSNYILLGYILEIINRVSYFDQINLNFIAKLKLRNTYPFYYREISNVAHPVFNNQDLFDSSNNNYYKNFCFSAGSMASTSKELALLIKYIFVDSKIVNIKHYGFDKKIRYNKGIEKFRIDQKEYFGHHGDNIGYSSRVYYNPDNKFICVLLFNCSDYDKIDFVSKKILKIIHN